MGAGPVAILERARIADVLAAHTGELEVSWISEPDARHNEIERQFEINRELAGLVAAAVAADRRPLVVAGNCNTALGTLGGLGDAETGIVWLDAHGDSHTPETTRSGLLDGMALAMATGGCWTELSASIPGFRPVREEHAVLIGARDLEPGERERLVRSAIHLVAGRGPGELRTAEVIAALDGLAPRVRHCYLHIDLDVLDRSEGNANEYAAPGGLSLEELVGVIDAAAGRVPISAAAVTAYNPEQDPDGRIRSAATTVIARVAAALGESGS